MVWPNAFQYFVICCFSFRMCWPIHNLGSFMQRLRFEACLTHCWVTGLAGAERYWPLLVGGAWSPGDPAAQPPSGSLLWSRVNDHCASTVFLTCNWVQRKVTHFHVSSKRGNDKTAGVPYIHEQKMGKSLFLTIISFTPFMFSAPGSECHPSVGK